MLEDDRFYKILTCTCSLFFAVLAPEEVCQEVKVEKLGTGTVEGILFSATPSGRNVSN